MHSYYKWLVVLFVTAGCGGGNDVSVDAGPPDAVSCTEPARVVFLNRGGGDYVPGEFPGSGAANESSIIDEAVTIPPAPLDGVWDEVMACVREDFAAFNIEITDVDPGTSGSHYEVVMAPKARDIGLSAGVSSVAPYNCPTAENPDPMLGGVGWVLYEFVEGDAPFLCGSVSTTVGNMFTLDHAYHCPDLMTYLANCGDKSFVDLDVRCGELEERDCFCGGATQNSYQTIMALAGPACD